ncbi:zinc finger protein 569-like [Culicoides brevitarsis]|uniref:zinc finger protein 569-like n=1 Tax=Culicoides brevitarsis TaxID=469753 RepID=UPI00307BD414
MSLPLADLRKHDQQLTVKDKYDIRVVAHDESDSSLSSDYSTSSSSSDEDFDEKTRKKMNFQYKKTRKRPLYLNNEGGEKTLYCYYCKEYFNRTPDHPKNFVNHIKLIHAINNPDGTFTCRHCGHETPDKKVMRRHFNVHRIFDEPIVCQNCGETFYNYRAWRSHSKKHQKKRKSFGCYLCGNVYTSKPSLISHLMSVHEQLGRKCKYCHKCILFEAWDEHEKMELELRKEPFEEICEYCAQTFTSKESAANHRRNFHLNKPTVTCSECGKTFRTTTNLAQHRTNKHAEKRFECRECGYRSSYKYLVHIHIKKMHPSTILHGMPDNAVIEHAPGTAGRQDNRRKRSHQLKIGDD